MSKSEREEIMERADFLPAPSTKAPRPPESREQKRQKYQKYGKVPPWRLPPSLIEAVKQAAGQEEVTPRDLAEFLIAGGLELLAAGRIELPKQENEGRGPAQRVKEFPGIPERFV